MRITDIQFQEAGCIASRVATTHKQNRIQERPEKRITGRLSTELMVERELRYGKEAS